MPPNKASFVREQHIRMEFHPSMPSHLLPPRDSQSGTFRGSGSGNHSHVSGFAKLMGAVYPSLPISSGVEPASNSHGSGVTDDQYQSEVTLPPPPPPPPKHHAANGTSKPETGWTLGAASIQALLKASDEAREKRGFGIDFGALARKGEGRKGKGS